MTAAGSFAPRAVRPSRACGFVAAWLALAASAGCAARVFTPPAGPGAPAPDAEARLAEATARCRGASSYVGRTSLSGRAGPDSIPSVGIGAGLTRDGGIYLDAQGPFNTQVFWLSGRGDDATLFLRDDNAYVVAPAPAIVEALVGVPLGPDRLLAMLTGCISRDLAVSEAAAYDGGELIRVTTGDATLYLRRSAGQWRVRAGEFDGLTIDLVEFGPAFPADLRIVSDAGAATPVNLRVRVSPPIRVNDAVNEELFTQQPPAGATPITLDDLRAAGPLRTRVGGSRP